VEWEGDGKRCVGRESGDEAWEWGSGEGLGSGKGMEKREVRRRVEIKCGKRSGNWEREGNKVGELGMVGKVGRCGKLGKVDTSNSMVVAACSSSQEAKIRTIGKNRW